MLLEMFFFLNFMNSLVTGRAMSKEDFPLVNENVAYSRFQSQHAAVMTI